MPKKVLDAELVTHLDGLEREVRLANILLSVNKTAAARDIAATAVSNRDKFIAYLHASGFHVPGQRRGSHGSREGSVNSAASSASRNSHGSRRHSASANTKSSHGSRSTSVSGSTSAQNGSRSSHGGRRTKRRCRS
jgi:hypothetical protein